MLERDLEEPRSNCSTMNKEKVQQQKNYSMLERKLEELSTSCNTTKVQQQGRVCEPCPQGWSPFSSKCYYFSTERKIWTDSRSDCIKRGADLVIIESEEEQRFITSKTQYHTWIGLSYSEFKSNWLWVDGTPLQKGFWGSGKPAYESGSDCAMIATKMNAWDAYYCSNNEQWICETNALLP
ncbi:CD209 antigen-like protein A isoform X2 [Anguilla rostrata]|uniref:CD209 antigen-like protein A isoform X2 n=1 Tax=Anguilla rostrata TaxID=7938 RepID=UPI0030D1A0D2